MKTIRKQTVAPRKKPTWHYLYYVMTVLIIGAFAFSFQVIYQMSEALQDTVAKNEVSTNLQNRLDNLAHVIKLIHTPMVEAVRFSETDTSRVSQSASEANDTLPMFQELTSGIREDFKTFVFREKLDSFEEVLQSIQVSVQEMATAEQDVFTLLKKKRKSHISAKVEFANEKLALGLSRIRYLKSQIQQVQSAHMKAQANAAKNTRQQEMILIGVISLIVLVVVAMGQVFSSRLFRLFRELSEQREQLIHSEKLASVGELAAGVGHEINNPLAIIKGTVSRIQKNLEKRDALDAPTTKSIDTLNIAIDRVAKIVNGLRTYARSNTDQVEPIDCHQCIEETVQMVGIIYEKEGIQLRKELHAKNSMILGNVGKFQQVIMNMISNAKDATENRENRTITLKTTQAPNQITIHIADNGCGIEEENISKIFDAFFTTKVIGKGTGMGLGLCAQFIREMHGEVNVESKVEKGTTFRMTFPTTSQVVQLPQRNQAQPEVSLKGNVLVVDDEPMIRELLREELEDLGLTVDEAEDGQVGLEKISAGKYDFVFTDMKMPRMSGDELVSQTRKLGFDDLKMFVVSGGVTTDYDPEKLKALDQQVNGYLSKPYNRETLISLLTQEITEPKKAA